MIKPQISIINNPLGYKYLAILGMIYMSLMFLNAILTNCYVGYDEIFVLGGTLTSPLVFIFDNIIAEVYGYKITRSIILAGICIQTIFILICQIIINAHHPSFFQHKFMYEQILGAPLLQIHLSGCIAYLISILINTKIITYWKVLLHGRKFFLRSFSACSLSELLYSLIAISLMENHLLSNYDIIKITVISYSIKVFYSLLFLLPAYFLVELIRRRTGIDVYDFNHDFTPSKYYKQVRYD